MAPRITATGPRPRGKGARVPEIGMLTPIRGGSIDAQEAVVPSLPPYPWKTGELKWKTRAAKDAATKAAQKLFSTYAETSQRPAVNGCCMLWPDEAKQAEGQACGHHCT